MSDISLELDKRDFSDFMVYIHSNDEYGTGVLVRPSEESEVAYVISASHIFSSSIEGKDDSGKIPSGFSKSSLTKIYINNYSDSKKRKEIKLLDNSFYHFGQNNNSDLSENYDLAFSVIDLKANGLQKLPSLSIFSSKLRVQDNLFAMGYSAEVQSRSTVDKIGYNELDLVPADKAHHIIGNENEESILVKGGYHKYDMYKGMSGGAVFIKRGETVELYGIIIKAYSNNKLTMISLNNSKILERIFFAANFYKENDLLDKNTELEFIPKTFYGDYTYNLKEILENEIEYFSKNFSIEDNEYLKDISSTNFDDFLNENAKKVNKDLKNNRLLIKKIADYYAYISFRFHRNKKYWQSGYYINKASSLNSEKYGIIALKERNERNSKEISKSYRKKINIVEKEESSPYSIFIAADSLIDSSLDNSEKKENIYYCLNFIKNNEKNIISKIDCESHKLKYKKELENILCDNYLRKNLNDELYFYEKGLLHKLFDENEVSLKYFYLSQEFMKLKDIKGEKNLSVDNEIKLLTDEIDSDSFKKIQLEKNIFIEENIDKLGGRSFLIKKHEDKKSDQILEKLDQILKTTESEQNKNSEERNKNSELFERIQKIIVEGRSSNLDSVDGELSNYLFKMEQNVVKEIGFSSERISMDIDNIPEKTKNVISEQINQAGEPNVNSDFQKSSKLISVKSKNKTYKILTIMALILFFVGALWLSSNSELMREIDEWIKTVR